MALPLDALVFVYGTLKHGFGNHDAYIKPALALGKAQYVAAAKTSDAVFHLVLVDNDWIPCMYRAPSGGASGYQVPGEVYRVDRDVLAALDILEGVDEAIYLREEIPVELLDAGEVVTCLSYIVPHRDELLQFKCVSEYTLEMHDDDKFRQRTPSLRILGALFGSEVADKVQALVDSGVNYHDARVQVLAQ